MGTWVGAKFIFPAKRVLDSGSKGWEIGFRGVFVSEGKCELNLRGDKVKIKGHTEKGSLLRKITKCVNDWYSNKDPDVLKWFVHNFYASITSNLKVSKAI